jgi:hypothetical protein
MVKIYPNEMVKVYLQEKRNFAAGMLMAGGVP